MSENSHSISNLWETIWSGAPTPAIPSINCGVVYIEWVRNFSCIKQTGCKISLVIRYILDYLIYTACSPNIFPKFNKDPTNSVAMLLLKKSMASGCVSCQFLYCNKSVTLVRDVDNGEAMHDWRQWVNGKSLSFNSFFSEPIIALKNNVYYNLWNGRK